MSRYLAAGLAGGSAVGGSSATAEYFLYGRRLHEVRLFDALVLYPAIGLAVGYLRYRIARDGEVAEASAEVLAVVDSGDEATRHTRFLVAGFLVGVVIGAASTIGDLAWRGYFILPYQLVYNLLFYPCIAASIGANLSREADDPQWIWPRLRFRMSTMMILVAYLAIVMGLASETSQIGGNAKRYHSKYLNALSMVQVYGAIAEKTGRDAPLKLKNAESLRDGDIPQALDPQVRSFLADYRTKAGKQEVKSRFESIANGEERLGRIAEKNFDEFSKLTDHYSKLAAKYDKAQAKPWLPVEPDPPRP